MLAFLDWPDAIVLASLILGGTLAYSARCFARKPGPGQFFTRFAPPESGPPLFPEGRPVEPSGIPIEPEARLERGDRVLASSQGLWWQAEVRTLGSDDWVAVHFLGWDSTWDEVLPRERLQVDLGLDEADREG